jgi:hypothetical protein
MPNRLSMRSTTMLSGIVGWTFLTVWTAGAADMAVYTKAPPAPYPVFAPAVDAVNGKFDGFAGSVAGKSVSGVNGIVTMPLGGQYGAQFDGSIGSLDGHTFAAGAGHLFWRDPSRALLGLYVSETYWDRFGGLSVGHVAGEGEYYWGRFTLQGIAGVEFGNSASTNISTISTGPVFTTTTTFVDAYHVKTRFFDEINLKYYFGDDLSGYVGHRYLGGLNALALGAEIARPLGHGTLASAFVEGRIGENNASGVWGGVKLYFGPTDQPLIARHRNEDPNNWNVDNLFGILGNHASSVGTARTCTLGRDIGNRGNCENPGGPPSTKGK